MAMPCQISLELFRREVFESRRLLAEIYLLKHAIFRALSSGDLDAIEF